jgi:hypothetical protein
MRSPALTPSVRCSQNAARGSGPHTYAVSNEGPGPIAAYRVCITQLTFQRSHAHRARRGGAAIAHRGRARRAHDAAEALVTKPQMIEGNYSRLCDVVTRV